VAANVKNAKRSAKRTRWSLSMKVFIAIGYFVLLFFAAICVIPFIMMLSGSLSNEQEVLKYGYSILPRQFSLDAYKALLVYSNQLIRSYTITIEVTVIGTGLTLFLTSLTGYVLSRSDFIYRDKVSFFIYFTTLFSGGIVPWYMVITQYLHLKNSFWVLIVPTLLAPFNIFLVKNFLKAIPDSLVESARIDGAKEFYIYWKIILPLAKPCLATIALFTALGHWNNWYLSSVFITQPEKYTLQYVLYNIMQNAQYFEQQARQSGITTGTQSLPKETVKLAMALITTGPVVLFYPFAQKYFVEGLTIGSVKG
jgi:putative aldouronate transport system permease protein